MKEISDLNEYRNERLRKITTFVQNTADDYLRGRSEEDYAAIIGKADSQKIELFVSLDTVDTELIAAPEHVLNEVAISLADALSIEDTISYTVDMSQIRTDRPYILIRKL